ncbi:MAG: type II and III secretion system protein family protein [Burkholderiaceae bacterium]|nr:type II and III secretion system protein family protein [Burkholderiaceae bacterium]
MACWLLLMASPVQAQQATSTPATATQSGLGSGQIALAVRGQRTLTFNGTATRVAVANPEVADVQVLSGQSGSSSELLLVANQAGTTNVQVWVAGRKAPLQWTVSVHSDVQEALTRRGQAPTAHVDIAGGQALVSGESASLLDHRKAVDSAGATPVLDHAVVAHGGMVQVEVKVVELSRNVMKDVGVRFGAGGSGPWGGGVSLRPPNTSGTGLISGPAAVLNAGFSLFYTSRDFSGALSLLESSGMARILAEPTLVAMSGQSASFLAGGEIPVPQAGSLGTQTVVYKPFGIGLTVTPTVLSPSRIALKVAPEASELDYVNAVPIISGEQTSIMPAIRTRRADTMIELADGESFVISGLVSRQTIADVAKVPLLGDLPIIGSFFRSVRYSQEERELVIMVTPRLVRPIAKGVTLPLPGGRQEVRDSPGNAWGYYLGGAASTQQMPGFSR